MSSTIIKIKRVNSECENALIDFPFHDKVETWIKDHQSLFAACTTLENELELSNTNAAYSEFIIQFQKIYLQNNNK
jgi:hypothetical protein